MAVSFKQELVGVLGYPVAENPTVVMQEAAFSALGLPWRYLTLEVKPESLAEAVRGARALGLRGLNLTIPHKIAVIPMLDEISPDAAMIGAVNTVRRDGDRLIGENTDGKGFLRGLREKAGIEPAGKKVLLLGAGGAARAIAVELALAGAACITIVNRNRERGETLADDVRIRTKAAAGFVPLAGGVEAGRDIDILVNATSIGLFPDVNAAPPVDLKNAGLGLVVCDVVPNPPVTRLIAAARGRGLKTVTGLSMLVYQGAIGFKMWTGQTAPVEIMERALQEAFAVS